MPAVLHIWGDLGLKPNVSMLHIFLFQNPVLRSSIKRNLIFFFIFYNWHLFRLFLVVAKPIIANSQPGGGRGEAHGEKADNH